MSTQDLIDTYADPDAETDPANGLFHLLAALIEWCDEHSVNFDLMVEEVRQMFRETGQ